MKKWPLKTLESVCTDFLDGDWVESKDQSSSGIRLIQTGNVGLGEYLNRGQKGRYISLDTFTRLRCTEVFTGDCLISRLPDPIGRCCILPDTRERMITAVDCTIARFDSRQLLPQFFRYYSQSPAYQNAVRSATTGATRQRISRRHLGLIPIPVPPLPEQERIVRLLDEADALRKLRAQADKRMADFIPALFDEMFGDPVTNPKGWPMKRLGEVGTIATGHTPPTRFAEYFGGTIPFVCPADLNSGRLIRASQRTLTSAGAAVGRMTRAGSVLVGCIGQVGITAMAGIPVAFNQQINAIDFAEEVEDHFGLACLSLMAATLRARAVHAVVPILNKGRFSQIEIPVPPAVLQRRFARRMTDVTELAQEARSGEGLCERLFQSMLHQAFEGEP